MPRTLVALVFVTTMMRLEDGLELARSRAAREEGMSTAEQLGLVGLMIGLAIFIVFNFTQLGDEILVRIRNGLNMQS